MIVLAVRDRAIDAFGTPIFAQSVGQALRSFSDEVNRADPSNQMNHHPEDFDLYRLAEFETDTGEFTQTGPEMVSVGKDCLIKVQ